MSIPGIFPEWMDDSNPFDIIGFAQISSQAPSQQDFAKAVRYAEYMTDPRRIGDAGSEALGLPYSSAQVKQAVDYFTDRIGHVDRDVWEWAYEELTVSLRGYQYERTWAPETRRWEACILRGPIVVDLTPSAVRESEDLGDDTSLRSISLGASSKERAGFSLLPALKVSQHSTPSNVVSDPSAATSTTDSAYEVESRMPTGITLRNSPSSSSTCPTPESSIEYTEPAPALHLDTTKGHNNHDTSRKRKRPHRARSAYSSFGESEDEDNDEHRDTPVSTSGRQSAHIFLGFYREQLRLAGQNDTKERDYRQPVEGFIDHRGYAHRKLGRNNLAGKPIPSEFCLPRNKETAVKHELTLYHGEFAGLDQVQVHHRIKRLAKKGSSGDEFRKRESWVSTFPAATGKGSAAK
ncbi:hypothetical protein MN608_05520 [Microdochium nivale]|nr:hypothetical protein MN608_05520 [Microdochium nivale]